jgi:hypothetical protein
MAENAQRIIASELSERIQKANRLKNFSRGSIIAWACRSSVAHLDLVPDPLGPRFGEIVAF